MELSEGVVGFKEWFLGQLNRYEAMFDFWTGILTTSAVFRGGLPMGAF